MKIISKLSSIFKAIEEYIADFKGLSMKMKITFYILFFFSLIVLIGGVSLFLTGCASPSYAYVKADYENASPALDDLIQYIGKDPNIQPLDKEVRIKSIEKWREMINNAYKQYEKDGIK